MTTVLLDTHVAHWWSAEPERLSPSAARVVDAADELAVSSVTWYELAWLAGNGRIEVTVPVRSWLDALSRELRTAGISPSIAVTAAGLPSTFPGDPADRLIYATATELDWTLVTKDRRLRSHAGGGARTVW